MVPEDGRLPSSISLRLITQRHRDDCCDEDSIRSETRELSSIVGRTAAAIEHHRRFRASRLRLGTACAYAPQPTRPPFRDDDDALTGSPTGTDDMFSSCWTRRCPTCVTEIQDQKKVCLDRLPMVPVPMDAHVLDIHSSRRMVVSSILFHAACRFGAYALPRPTLRSLNFSLPTLPFCECGRR